MSRTVLLQVEAGGGTDVACARVEAARRAGFDGVEWLFSINAGSRPPNQCVDSMRHWRASRQWHPEGISEEDSKSVPSPIDTHVSSIRRVRSLIPVVTVAADCPAVDDAGLTEEVRTAIRLAGVVAPTTLSLSFLPLRCNQSATGFNSYQTAINAVHNVLRSHRFEAASLGVTLAVVVPQDGFLLSPVEARELIESINAWNIGACVNAARVQPIGRLGDWIATLGPRVRAVRVGEGKETEAQMSKDPSGDAWGVMPHDAFQIVSSCVPESRWPEWIDLCRTSRTNRQS